MPTKYGISYYGGYHQKNIVQNLNEIKNSGFDILVLAVSENDWRHFRPALQFTVAYAQKLALEVIIDLWGFAGCFGGESASLFLVSHPDVRQVLNTRQKVPMACLNNPELRTYLKAALTQMITSLQPQGFFLDEPHFYFNPLKKEYSCFCPTCLSLMEKKGLNPTNEKDLQKHKNETLLSFSTELTQHIKEQAPQLLTILCLFPDERDPAYQKDDFVKLGSLDVLATDPYWQDPAWQGFFDVEDDFVIKTARRLQELTQKYNKKSELWLQGFALKAGQEALLKQHLAEVSQAGLDRIMFWTYQCGWGSLISSARPSLCWKIIKKQIKEIKGIR